MLTIRDIAQILLRSLIGAFVLFLWSTSLAFAQTVVELTVNGGATANVNNGDSVLLEWYISGNVSNCSINNGVGAINTAVLPVQGSQSVTPPDNGSTSYTLTCTGGTSGVTVFVNPIITLSTEPVSVVYNPLVETAEFTLEWESRYATQCTKVWWATATNPGLQQWTTDANNADRGLTVGSVYFGDGGQGPITENITVYIQCSNVITGTQSTQSLFITVDDSVPPPAPEVDIWTDGSTTVSPDLTLGWAIVDEIMYTSDHVTSCTKTATRADGSAYASLPEGFEDFVYMWNGAYFFFDVRIATTTTFTVECTQPAYVFEGVNYPATTASDSLTITVSPAVSLDRSAVPPVSITLTAIENPVETDSSTGEAIAFVQVTAENAEYCRYWSTDPYTGNYYAAYGWDGQNRSGEKSAIEYGMLSTTTIMHAECVREFDLENFAPGSPEYIKAIASTSILMNVVEGTTPPAELSAFPYANATLYDAYDMQDIHTSMSGFSWNGGVESGWGASYPAWRDENNPNTNASITFPFNAYYPGSTGEYYIYVVYCDLNSGFNDFTLSTESGFSTTWRSDMVTVDGWCNTRTTTVVKKVGLEVELTDGELVTISCNNNNDPLKGEACILIAAGFGQYHDITAPVDVNTGFAPVSLMWMGQTAEHCYDALARPESGADYEYSAVTRPFHHLNTDIALNTTFEITCERISSDESDTGSLEITVDPGELIVASTTVDTGECIDTATGLLRQAEPGERSGTGGVCEPAVDLGAVSPAMSFASAVTDNVAGTYDSIDALVVIQNLGLLELPAGSNIPYQAELIVDSTIAAAFGVPTDRVSPSTPTFNDSIPAPNMVGYIASPPTDSPTLTRTFDDVPFGTHQLCARVNLDDSNNHVYGEWNIVTLNNESCATVTLPVPPPPMTLTTNREVARRKQPVTIDWSLNVTYDMNCTIQGPGGLNQTLDTLNPDTNPYSGSFTTNALTSTSKFQFECVEPLTNTVFIEEVVVEVIPSQQEV